MYIANITIHASLNSFLFSKFSWGNLFLVPIGITPIDLI